MSIFVYNMTYSICIFLAMGWVGVIQAAVGKYPIQNFTPTEYKAGIQNIDFAQNRDMTLFVANNLGVLSFNGKAWNRHDFRTGKKKRSLAFDQVTNRLYVGSQGAFGYFQGDWEYVSLTDLVPENARDFDEVWDVFLLNSEVYFCTFRGLYVYDGQSVSVIEHAGGLGRSFLANGKMFTQSQQGEILEVEGRKLIHRYPQARSGRVLAGVIADGAGYLLFYNSGQIEFTTSFGVDRKYEDLEAELEGTYVNHVLQLSDTRLVIATQTSGLFLYDLQERSLENITVADGLLTNACLRAFQDYSGNLWVGMQNGMAIIYINSPMRLISQEINLQGSGYEVLETAEGTYFSTSNGIYFLANDATRSTFLSGTEGPAYGMMEIAGKQYAGHHTGLFLLENGRARRLVNTDGLWLVKQLRSHPEYALGGTYSGLYIFRMDEDQTLEGVRKIQGFNDSSRFFEEDDSGNIWVGQYYRGLYRLTLSEDLTQATTERVREDADLPIAEQILLSRVVDDLYLSTTSGLYELDPVSSTITRADLFFDEVGEQAIYLFEQDHKNNVHLLAENTVGFFRQISAGNYQFVPSSLYQLRYHLNNDLLHISTSTDHGVLFSANEGFIHYDPELENPLSPAQPLLISRVFSVTANRTLYVRKPFEPKPAVIDRLVVKPADKVLKIEVESFQFNDMTNQQFRYFLQGFDDDFGEWTTAATKEYTNLTEGEYVFWVQTRNYLGKVTTSLPLNLTVDPPFYRSSWARGLYVLSAVLILWLVSRRQKRRYRQKTAQLEATRQIELAKEQQKRINIQQQKEQELLRLKEEKMQSELQHVNSLLAASTMNLVVKNEFIETIKDELEEVKRKGERVETKRALEKIVKEIDITLKLQEDWEQFEYHFDAVHGDFLTRLREDYPDLSPNEQKLCAFLRLNLNTKDIANLLGISVRGVEVARYRLRKKLDLNSGQNLSKFILEY